MNRHPRPDASPLRILGVAAVLLALVMVSLRLLPGGPFAAHATARWMPPPSASPSHTPLPLQPAEVRLDAEGWWSWAMLDTRTGELSGSANMAETSTTASMIKAWIVADYLRRTGEANETPSSSRLQELSAIIRDSNNEYASELFQEVGRRMSVERLVKICGLTDSGPAVDGSWSRIEMSARDTARMGACIADGRAAGPWWTDWLLEEMRQVRGVGDFGLRKAFPADEQADIAIKNGWIERSQEREYHVNCLAIGDGWTMGVMLRYPFGVGGYEYGMRNCEEIAAQLIVAS
jgi:hypothetical protein